MRQRRAVVCALTGLLLAVSASAAGALPGDPTPVADAPTQGPDGSGTGAWLAFPRNVGGDTELVVQITSTDGATGTVAVQGLNWSAPFDVSAGGATSITLPGSAELTDAAGPQARGVRVSADKPVTAVAVSRAPYSTEATAALPDEALGTNHLVMAWPAGTDRPDLPSQIAVVATQDATKVTVVPTVRTSSGWPAGKPVVRTLDAGQVLAVESVTGDLTGTAVRSSHPVAVLAGARCALVPDASTWGCNHLVEQVPPTTAWGTRFLAVPMLTRVGGDTMRVLAGSDDTVVLVDGQEIARLKRGQAHQFTLLTPAEVTTSAPALLAQFANGRDFDGVAADPLLMDVAPVAAFHRDHLVGAPGTGTPSTEPDSTEPDGTVPDSSAAAGMPGNFLTIVVPTDAAATLTVDGWAVPAGNLEPIGASDFSAVRLPVDLGVHQISASEPVGVQVYGFGSYDAYGLVSR